MRRNCIAQTCTAWRRLASYAAEKRRKAWQWNRMETTGMAMEWHREHKHGNGVALSRKAKAKKALKCAEKASRGDEKPSWGRVEQCKAMV